MRIVVDRIFLMLGPAFGYLKHRKILKFKNQKHFRTQNFVIMVLNNCLPATSTVFRDIYGLGTNVQQHGDVDLIIVIVLHITILQVYHMHMFIYIAII